MEIEQEAREMGWRPLEEFPGDPEKFISAEEFVERGKTLMPILRKNNEKLHNELTAVKGQVQTLSQNLKDAQEAMESYREYASTAAKTAYDKAVNDIKAQKAAAIEDGDMRGVMKADQALDELREAAPQPLKKVTATPPSPPPAQLAPEYLEWKAENSWVDTDTEKTSYAAGISSYLRTQYPTLMGRAFLDKLTEEVNSRFGSQKPVNRTDGGQRQGNSGGGKGYDSLPAEAKAACDRMTSKLVGPNKVFKTQSDWRKQYASDYFTE